MQNSSLSFSPTSQLYPNNLIQDCFSYYPHLLFSQHILSWEKSGSKYASYLLVGSGELLHCGSSNGLQLGGLIQTTGTAQRLNANPVWKTKFAVSVDDSESNLNDLALHVEVYSREPLFLREKLQGSATILLKEFLAKHDKNSEASARPGTEEVGSYQLRKKSSNKPQGFVDVSIRISEDREEPYSDLGNEGGHVNDGNSITLATGDGPAKTFPTEITLAPFHRPEYQARANYPYTHPIPFPTNYNNPPAAQPSYPPASGPSYQPPRTPPPPPPPSNAGYRPTFLPRPDRMPETYINMPSSSSSGAPPGRGGAPGFAMGMGAGALAAGAVIFGDDFMSGFHVPSGFNDPTLVISTDPPF